MSLQFSHRSLSNLVQEVKRPLTVFQTQMLSPRIHIINNPRLFNMFLSLCKPLVNERLRESIILHG